MLSVVIPALDAAATISASIDSVRGADEILVVDGGSADCTVAVAAGAGARILNAPRGRGSQLHAGAIAARGDWLLFLHADTQLAPGWREAVDTHISQRGEKAAFFRLVLDADAWQARLVEAGVRWRGRLFGLPYGDQGLLISRRLYDAVGGFRTLPLMEDVDFVRRLGRSRFSVLDIAAVTSAERWRRDGWFRRTARNHSCLLLYALGVSPARIARFYR